MKLARSMPSIAAMLPFMPAGLAAPPAASTTTMTFEPTNEAVTRAIEELLVLAEEENHEDGGGGGGGNPARISPQEAQRLRDYVDDLRRHKFWSQLHDPGVRTHCFHGAGFPLSTSNCYSAVVAHVSLMRCSWQHEHLPYCRTDSAYIYDHDDIMSSSPGSSSALDGGVRNPHIVTGPGDGVVQESGLNPCSLWYGAVRSTPFQSLPTH